MTKSGREIVEILRAYDLTQTAWSTAQLAGCDPKTVKRYVEARDAGRSPYERDRRPRAIDPFLDNIEQWGDDSHGKVRADVAHRKLVAMGFTGNERSTSRAVAEAKAAWRAGRRRTFRPWVPEPGLWLQFVAAEAGRFAVGALGEVTRADEAHSAQPGTGGWAAFGR